MPWTSRLVEVTLPSTSSLLAGAVVPIPTLPEFCAYSVLESEEAPPDTEKVVKLELAINNGSLNSNLLFVEFHFKVAFGVVVPLSNERYALSESELTLSVFILNDELDVPVKLALPETTRLSMAAVTAKTFCHLLVEDPKLNEPEGMMWD